MAIAPARLIGRVLTDAGEGLGNVGVLMTRGAVSMNARTASDGSFSFAAAPGPWEVAIDGGSLPSGYSTTVNASRSVVLDRAQPGSATLELRGRVVPATSTLVLEPGGRTVPVDAGGSFAIRSLPAGEIMLRAGNATQRITLPNGPARIADVVVGGR